ncbi:MAG: MFS transporter, partial [Flavobacteriales bacterium]
IFIPLSVSLIKKYDQFQKPPERSEDESTKQNPLTRKKLLKDKTFWMILPGSLFLPFFITGFFIHQNLIAANSSWTMEWMAICFIGFGISRILAYIVSSYLVDKFSSRRVFIFQHIPIMLGTLILLLFDHKIALMIFMVLTGLTASTAVINNTGIWAEIYGVEHLGMIKGLVSSFVIFSTSMAPVIMSYLFASEFMMRVTFVGVCLSIVFLVILASYAVKKRN